jgi:plasmid stabilization system protein ParE
MKITFSPHFKRALESILTYIGKESKAKAKQFNKDLFIAIGTLDHFPYKCRRSIYFESEEVRDYVFMGYTIPYLIDKPKDTIVILDIFKWTDHERKEI